MKGSGMRGVTSIVGQDVAFILLGHTTIRQRVAQHKFDLDPSRKIQPILDS
jgi:hypothetical protein